MTHPRWDSKHLPDYLCVQPCISFAVHELTRLLLSGGELHILTRSWHLEHARGSLLDAGIHLLTLGLRMRQLYGATLHSMPKSRTMQ